jgi:hypothetical protein
MVRRFLGVPFVYCSRSPPYRSDGDEWVRGGRKGEEEGEGDLHLPLAFLNTPHTETTVERSLPPEMCISVEWLFKLKLEMDLFFLPHLHILSLNDHLENLIPTNSFIPEVVVFIIHSS